MFYGSGNKVVPTNISDYLTPLAVATWFMDDGTCSSGNLVFATQSFTLEENNILSEALMTNFGIHARIWKSIRSRVDGIQLYTLGIRRKSGME